MSRIFISHSSRNNAEALALQAWLEGHGWPKGEVFLDIDPEHGLVAGQRWVAELLKAAGRCEAVICAISPEWLASSYCRVELNQAMSKGKAVFGVIVRPVGLAEIQDKLPELTSNYQVVDLSAPGEAEEIPVAVPPDGRPETVRFRRDGLIRLRTGLMKAGIDARTFAFDAKRPIFPGLRALEEQDAAIFFGRDGKIVEGLDALRRSVFQDRSHVFCIVGASGSGKSSFLRAGLYPRLERDDRHWLPLPPLRPLKAILSGRDGLYASLEKRFDLLGAKRAQGELKQQLQQPGGFAAVIGELRRRAHSRMLDETAPLPTVVLPIDQGEELFDAQQAEGQAFLEQVAGVNAEMRAGEPPALVVLIAIRSDNFEKLQKNEILAPSAGAIFSLPPMPKGTFKEVIEGPVHQLNAAREEQLHLDPKLVEQLLLDVSGESSDSLPLLAFVLESLFTGYSKSGGLTLANYEASGRLQGAILAAVKKAFDDYAPGIPADEKEREALLRRAFIPWLARVDETSGEVKRNVARWEDIPAEARPLIEKLIEVRLLRSYQPTDSEGRPDPAQPRTVEPAHEALLRKWTLLKDWLRQEHANLMMLETLLRSAREWDEHARSPDYINHKGGRLQDAVDLARHEDYQAKITGLPRAYLDRARSLEKEQYRIKNLLVTGISTAFVALCFVVLAWINQSEAYEIWARVFYFRGYEHLQSELSVRLGMTFRECSVDIGEAPQEAGPRWTQRSLNHLKNLVALGYSKNCPTMVVVKVQNAVGEKESDDSEAEQLALAVSMFEITAEQYLLCVSANACGVGSNAGKQPIASLSYWDALSYVRWLSKMTGAKYRLLTEDEWNLIAGDPIGIQGNYGFMGKGEVGAEADIWFGVSPVGDFEPNLLGLYDVYGNVREWVKSCPEGARANWLGTAFYPVGYLRRRHCETGRALGGSFLSLPSEERSRESDFRLGDKMGHIGLRVARELRSP